MIFKSDFPIYKQHDAMDCGPACLRMITKHYGKSYSLQYFRERSYVSREGASLLGLRDAAVSAGMRAKCALVSMNYLEAGAKLPCIVHWDNSHFVVVYKIKNDQIYLADPACGKRRYQRETFLSHWAVSGDEGYALLLEPADEFDTQQEDGTSPKSFFILFSYLKSYKQLFIQLVLAMLLGGLLQLILPFLTQIIVDKGINGKDIGLLQMVLLGQFLLIASRTFVSFIRGWILFYISTPVNITLVYDFLLKLMKLPLGFFDVKMIGDTLQRINDHRRVETFITDTVLSILLTLINFIIFGIVLVAYSFPIFLIFCAGTILYLCWIQLFLAKRREIDFAKFRQLGKNQNMIIQLIMGMQEIRLHNCEKKKITDWVKIQDDLFSISKKYLSLTQNQQAGCFLLQETQNIVITYFAARSVIEGDITLGMMLAILFILGQLNGPIEQLVHFVAGAQDAKISFERIEEIHAMQEEEHAGEIKKTDIPKEADIVISNVSFQYGGPYSPEVIKNVSIVLPNKKITAIVGTSGSGKTTLLKLLLGVYRPTGGDLWIGNIPMTDILRSSWRNKCGLVMQDGYIFSDTIAGNIALKDEMIDENRLKQAAQVANIAEFINSLPLGYQTLIGSDGQGLSQGQKQRILIARAVYKNPEYLFFDEATNSLDACNEAMIMKNLDLFFKNRTVVIVAHRLSTVRNADQIVVLDEGVVVETGTHAGLITKKGVYFNLVKNQLELGSE
ncbi:MAG: peptidase transporter [Firmicutes bacterium]|nr:peptidase transporter [Bacillota bacterium]